MPYVQRDNSGKVIGRFANLQPGFAEEWLDDDAPEFKAEQKALKWDAIKAERDRRKSGGFKIKVGSSNKWFHSDADSRIQHLNLKDKARDLIAAGGQASDVLQANGKNIDDWKILDGTVVTITAQIAFDLVAAAGDLDAILHAVAERHKAAMEASDDPANYDFSAGWPESF